MITLGSEPPFKGQELFKLRFPDNFKAVKWLLDHAGDKPSAGFGRAAFEKRCMILGMEPDSLELGDLMSYHLIPNETMMNLRKNDELK